MSIEKSIKNLRWELFMTQSEFADAIGVEKNTVCFYENGRRKPKLKTIKKMKQLADENNIKINIVDFLE